MDAYGKQILTATLEALAELLNGKDPEEALAFVAEGAIGRRKEGSPSGAPGGTPGGWHHGLEALRDGRGKVIAHYANMGDPYRPTLLFDVEAGRWLATGWGEWYERWEERRLEGLREELEGHGVKVLRGRDLPASGGVGADKEDPVWS